MKINIQFRKCSLVIAAALISLLSNAQLILNYGLTPTQMAQNLVGTGVQILNASVTAADSSYAYYVSNNTELGTSSGLLLTTGKAIDAIGPNNSGGNCAADLFPCSPAQGSLDGRNNFPGSSLLENFLALPPPYVTHDACIFEFDIIPQGDSIKFKYTFASEEYLEFVNTNYRDGFGFFLTGPNIGNDVNIAVVPGTNQNISCQTINDVDNAQYFVNNKIPPGPFIEFDGFTTGLEAVAGGLIPCETYHIKLIIADATDYLYNAGVFINAIESNPIALVTATSLGLEYMVEGCNDGSVTFSRLEATPQAQSLTYWIDGTATNGVDYTPQIGNGIPLSPNIIVIPANETSVTINLTAVDDNIDEGPEYLTIYLQNPACTGSDVLDSTNFYIYDDLVVDIQPDVANVCVGQCVDVVANINADAEGTFVWFPVTGIDDPTSLTNTICPTESVTYILIASLGTCSSSDSIVMNVSAIEINLTSTEINCEGGNTGTVSLDVIGAVDPLDIQWTGPNGFTSSDEDLTGLEQGEYCVTVTDVAGCVASGCITVEETNELAVTTSLSDYTCSPISCVGACDGSISTTIDGGVSPFTVSWTGPEGFTSPFADISGLCAGDYAVTVTDDLGCSITVFVTLEDPEPLNIDVVGTVDLLCTGVETGEATVTATGGCAPYQFVWSHDVILNAPVAMNLGSGSYEVSVIDQNNCFSQDSVTIVINDPINPVTAVLDSIHLYEGGFNVSCPGSEDGMAFITASGGSTPYSFEWNLLNEDATYAFEDLADAACGDWQLTVTDSNSCTYSMNVTLTCVPAINIEYDVVSNPCGAPEAGIGEISVFNITGGHGGPYTFLWSGPSCPCSGDSTLTGLNSGAYELTVTDTLGCSSVFTINVGQNDQFTAEGLVTDSSCPGSCDGMIDITITPPGTYSFLWSDGQTAEDAMNLCAGTYTVTITYLTCEEILTFEVGEPEPNQISIIETINPTCFGQNNGSIDIEVLGGSGDYSYVWTSNGDCLPVTYITEDINNLAECCYLVTVTDNVTGCIDTTTVCLDAPQVMDITVQLSAFDGGFQISCFGANDGQASVTVSGGTPDTTNYPPTGYFYDWENTGGNTTLWGNDPNASQLFDLGPGNYCVEVTDSLGCLATTCALVSEPDSLSSPAIIDMIDCNDIDGGSIDPNILGGSGTYLNFNWSGNIAPNPSDAAFLTGLPAGTFGLTMQDSNGCTAEFSYEIEETLPPVLQLDSAINGTCSAECNGIIYATITDGTAPYTVTINGSDPIVLSSAGPFEIPSLCGDIYTIAVSDSNACTDQFVVEIIQPLPLEVSLDVIVLQEGQPFSINCFGDSTGVVQATITGGLAGFTYEWTDGGGNIIPITDDILTDLGPGQYCVEVTDANGCTAQACAEVTQPETPLVASAILSSYPGGNNVSCFDAQDGAIDISVTGGVPDYTYLWSSPSSCSYTEGTQDQLGLSGGCIFDLLIVDSNLCDTVLTFSITQPEQITIVPQIINVSCNSECDGSIVISISGGLPNYEVSWTGPDNFTSNSTSLTGLCPGTYSVTVTDDLGCTHEESFDITEPDPLVVIIPDLFNCATGTSDICAVVTGGNGNYTYFWSTGATTNCIVVSQSGQICVTVTDDNGCVGTVCSDIQVYGVLSVSGDAVDATCGQCNGSIDITVAGGQPNYIYNWTGTGVVQGQADQADLCAGTYTVAVTDASGCTATAAFNITQADPIVVTEDITDVLCNGDSTGAIVLTFTGAVGNITVTWTNVVTGQVVGTGTSISNLPSGAYTYEWSDDGGCSGQSGDPIGVGQPAAIDLDVALSAYSNGFNISTVDGTDGSITAIVTGGNDPYSYDWGSLSLPITATVANGLTEGTYTLEVTDTNGCTADTTVTLIGPKDLALPTGLSPNGDGANDNYVIIGVASFPNNTFKVFNRWGNIVYEKSSYLNDWHGQNNNGEALSDGTYFVVFVAGDREFNTYVDLRRE
jgi:gliding motility-associated-like protein